MGERGTLYQIKERFIRRNIKKDVKQAVHPCREFIRFVIYGYVVLAAMKILNFECKDEIPEAFKSMNDDEKSLQLDNLAKEIIEKYAGYQYDIQNQSSQTSPSTIKSNRIKCNYAGCERTFVKDGVAKKHHMESCSYRNLDQIDLADKETGKYKKMC